MRAVLDTTVMVAAIRSNAGASNRLLQSALQGGAPRLIVSVPLLIEYEAVMTRVEHLDAARVTAAEVGVLLDAVAAVAVPVLLAFLWRPMLADVDDDMVLETAVNGGAEAIVTFNRRDFVAAQTQFGISVLLPGEALTQMEKKR